MKLRSGDWVEVRSKEEILRTLDKKGRLEELPFMPQMFQYCGQRFQVYKRAHKTCDTINSTGGRRLPDSVHLDLRCDGEAYGGCKAACLIFWKTAWLKHVGELRSSTRSLLSVDGKSVNSSRGTPSCVEADVLKGILAEGHRDVEEKRYVCQATQLLHFTTPLPWWNIEQYLEDYTSGNTKLKRIISGFAYAGFCILHKKLSRHSMTADLFLMRLYDKYQAFCGGIPFPRKAGTIQIGQSTPACSLNLQPGEFVRVKSYEEILATLDTSHNNRGMKFDAELVPYCGGTYRVRSRVNKFIDEKTGKILSMKTPAVILEDVHCGSRYSDCRLFCPRSIYPWWREIWLERAT